MIHLFNNFQSLVTYLFQKFKGWCLGNRYKNIREILQKVIGWLVPIYPGNCREFIYSFDIKHKWETVAIDKLVSIRISRYQ